MPEKKGGVGVGTGVGMLREQLPSLFKFSHSNRCEMASHCGLAQGGEKIGYS